MTVFLFSFTGAMIGGIIINYILQAPNPNWEEPITKDYKENFDD